MKNLITAIMTKCTGSTLSSAVGGRIFADVAPENSEFPYIVFSIVASTPDDVFDGEIEDTIVQFSIYSISLSLSEISTIQGYLRSLFKDARITVSGGTNIALEQQNLVTMTDEITTPAGTVTIRHWATDYMITVEAT